MLSLQTYELGFEVAYALLEAAHLLNHPRVRTTNVAK
ncbi:hypothetical protein CLV72_109242 [Allonocardiopsis opalescens]|uniref:Uncharacterized protein n=1 Tax=Allonocardiopsis opalescens TaxID=1144618 RepID=A0A2T0PVS6_9ACTN|nr:hypothetical protein CLV72_109242 [Allonocardiopsis opalescens]